MNPSKIEVLKSFLDEKFYLYHQWAFIEDDPICIPHTFTLKQDIEISGFFAAIFAWGGRKTIINKGKELMSRMDHAPYDFILNHSNKDLVQIVNFKHRTFNTEDLLYFVEFFHYFYHEYNSLEDAFTASINSESKNVTQGLIEFSDLFFSLPEYPERTKKHISSPLKNSSCKRLNM